MYYPTKTLDRIAIGHVTDFIAVGTFPVFNVADASISVGIGILVLGMLYQDIKDKKNNQQGSQDLASGESEDETSAPGHIIL